MHFIPLKINQLHDFFGLGIDNQVFWFRFASSIRETADPNKSLTHFLKLVDRFGAVSKKGLRFWLTVKPEGEKSKRDK